MKSFGISQKITKLARKTQIMYTVNASTAEKILKDIYIYIYIYMYIYNISIKQVEASKQ